MSECSKHQTLHSIDPLQGGSAACREALPPSEGARQRTDQEWLWTTDRRRDHSLAVAGLCEFAELCVPVHRVDRLHRRNIESI